MSEYTEGILSRIERLTPTTFPSLTNGIRCRLCGKGVHEIGGGLTRVNETGVSGIWECRPSCDAEMDPDDRLLAALEPGETP